MFIFVLIFFIVYVISFVYLIYKIKILEDDIDTLYDNYSSYIEKSFSRSSENV